MGTEKKWYLSKTVWLGLLMQAQVFFPPEQTKWLNSLIGIAVIILRFDTNQPLEKPTLRKKKN